MQSVYVQHYNLCLPTFAHYSNTLMDTLARTNAESADIAAAALPSTKRNTGGLKKQEMRDQLAALRIKKERLHAVAQAIQDRQSADIALRVDREKARDVLREALAHFGRDSEQYRGAYAIMDAICQEIGRLRQQGEVDWLDYKIEDLQGRLDTAQVIVQ